MIVAVNGMPKKTRVRRLLDSEKDSVKLELIIKAEVQILPESKRKGRT